MPRMLLALSHKQGLQTSTDVGGMIDPTAKCFPDFVYIAILLFPTFVPATPFPESCCRSTERP